MKRQSIDFRELERLLPLDQLPNADRARFRRAIAEGTPDQIERAGLVALHQLESLGAIQRVPGRNGLASSTVRFQTRSTLDIISLELPPTIEYDGIAVHPRLALIAATRTGLDSMRRLLRIDDPLVSADPLRGSARLGLIEEIDEIGCELLGALSVRLLANQPEDGIPTVAPFDAVLGLQARSDGRVVISCPDTSVAPALAAEGTQRGVRSFALAGVFSEDGAPLGHLEATHPEPRTFGATELALLALLSEFCGAALVRSSRIDKIVFIDPLTSAYNRSYFDRQVENEMARAKRESTSFALCIADIDDFKAFNTMYGYEAGNQVLKHVAEALRNAVRPFDTVARWGGEEFAVLLTAPVHGDDVVTICERLRSLVERQIVQIESLDRQVHRIGVTVSMGVAKFPDDEKTPYDLFRAANKALLRAKLPPKNRVVYYRPPGEWGAGPR